MRVDAGHVETCGRAVQVQELHKSKTETGGETTVKERKAYR
jgi:hypothetical protein